MLAMGLLDDDATRAPLLPLDDGAARAAHDAPARPRAARRRRARGDDGADRRSQRRGGGGMTALEATGPAAASIAARSSRTSTPGRVGPPSRIRPRPAGGAPTPRSRRRSSPASATARPRPGTSAAPSASGTASASRPSRSSTGGRRTRRSPPAGRGGSCRVARPSGPACTSGPASSSCRPSFVNVGAWIGEDTMVDSARARRLVRAGRRPRPPVGGRDARGRARARGRAAGHRGGRRVRRCRVVAARGRARRRRRGDRRGRRAHRDLAALRSRSWPGASPGRPTRRSPSRPGRSSCPGTRALDGDLARAHGLSVAVALLVKDRDAGTDARLVLEDALR